MPYTFRTFESIGETDLNAWNRVHELVGDAFTDPRFFDTVQRSVGSSTQCHPVIFYDEEGRAVAISSISSCKIDAALLAGPRARKLVASIRRLWPNYLYFTIAMCGPPVTVPQKKLCLLDGANAAEVLRLLDEALSDFAAKQRARVILAGDFDAADCSWLDALKDHGYCRCDSPPLHRLELRHASHREYLDDMRQNYRAQIRRDLDHFDTSQIRVETFHNGELPSPAITEEFYQLYLRLLDRVDFHLMTLPREFFEEYLQQFSDEVHFLRVFVENQPAAFAIGLTWKGTYCLTTIAVDPEVNKRYRLYFNLMHERIAYAMEQGLDEVILGITADDFKLRVGSCPRAQRIYVKTTGWLRLPFRLVSRFLVPTLRPMEPKRIFREPARKAA